MIAPAICPCCGYDLADEAPISFGPVSYRLRYGVEVCGHRLAIQPQCHEILGSLMRCAGIVISKSALIDRLGSNEMSNIIDVRLCHLRRAFAGLGVPFPIETIRGTGIVFRPELLEPMS